MSLEKRYPRMLKALEDLFGRAEVESFLPRRNQIFEACENAWEKKGSLLCKVYRRESEVVMVSHAKEISNRRCGCPASRHGALSKIIT